MTINELFAKAAAGTLTSGDITHAFCELAETSKVVRKAEERIVAAHTLTKQQMAEAYKAGNESIYDDQARGYTLD